MVQSSTPLGDYYDLLSTMPQEEMTERAEGHADHPALLAYCFEKSVKVVQERMPTKESFYPSARDPLPTPPTPVDQIRRTSQFAGHLVEGRTYAVRGAQSLDFCYVDREIFPGRSTVLGQRVAPRKLDFLLANAGDKLPIFAELKIRQDRLTYFALIQSLMLAAEILSSSQRKRLHESYGLPLRSEGPFLDLYIIAFDPPCVGRFRERAFNATEKISERLLQFPRVSRHLRRIACLEASGVDGDIGYAKSFAFGPGV